MSKVYAVREDNRERFLHRIKCDSCDEEIAPAGLRACGWVKCQQTDLSNKIIEFYY